MANVQPFRAIKPPPDIVHQIAAPPYDVMSREEACEMVEGRPNSFLHITRSEVDLPTDVDPYDSRVYEKARDNYAAFKRRIPLKRDAQPHYYVYSLEMEGHRQTGIAATPAVDDYNRDVIKKHEKTRRAKEDDRTRHILTTRAQTGPVFLTYRDHEELDRLTASVTEAAPLFDFTADDGVTHTVWQVPPSLSARVRTAFEKLPCLYIADGHHRAASAGRAAAQCRDEDTIGASEAAYDFFLCVIFPASQLQILPYNRVVKDLGGLTRQEKPSIGENLFTLYSPFSLHLRDHTNHK